jgi:hypothetical protein
MNKGMCSQHFPEQRSIFQEQTVRGRCLAVPVDQQVRAAAPRNQMALVMQEPSLCWLLALSSIRAVNRAVALNWCHGAERCISCGNHVVVMHVACRATKIYCRRAHACMPNAPGRCCMHDSRIALCRMLDASDAETDCASSAPAHRRGRACTQPCARVASKLACNRERGHSARSASTPDTDGTRSTRTRTGTMYPSTKMSE